MLPRASAPGDWLKSGQMAELAPVSTTTEMFVNRNRSLSANLTEPPPRGRVKRPPLQACRPY